MESEPPEVPALLSPADNFKIEAEILFDWEDVEDDSGVTYTFQIASDKNFNSIVLEKEDLTSSEYALPEETNLEAAKKDAPYYWQVKAVDGASNESEWTTPRSFYSGFQGLHLEGWLLYLVMGVGAFLIGLLGFWLGRRTAYTSSY